MTKHLKEKEEKFFECSSKDVFVWEILVNIFVSLCECCDWNRYGQSALHLSNLQ